MRSSKKDTTSCLALADDVRGSWSRKDTVLADEKLLDTVCGTNLGNQLNDLWVPVASITTDDQEGVLNTFWNREEDGGNERLGVVLLLEHNDLLTKTRATGALAIETCLPSFMFYVGRDGGVH